MFLREVDELAEFEQRSLLVQAKPQTAQLSVSISSVNKLPNLLSVKMISPPAMGAGIEVSQMRLDSGLPENCLQLQLSN